jgi:hypothetical protein
MQNSLRAHVQFSRSAHLSFTPMSVREFARQDWGRYRDGSCGHTTHHTPAPRGTGPGPEGTRSIPNAIAGRLTASVILGLGDFPGKSGSDASIGKMRIGTHHRQSPLPPIPSISQESPRRPRSAIRWTVVGEVP